MIRTHLDDLRIQLYNLLKICCDTEKFAAANILMEGMVSKATQDILKAERNDDENA